MALSSLIVYEPLDTFIDKRDYWSNYVSFYENYWGGPTSPYGVWFGQEYDNFRSALAEHFDIAEEEIEDCYFMKDSQNKYYLCPFISSSKNYILHSENSVPLHWFLGFRDDERESFLTPWGFAGISYDTRINLGFERLTEADAILTTALRTRRQGGAHLLFYDALGRIQFGLIDLKDWLGGFDPSGYLILSYGEISSFIHPYALKNERSVNDLWHILSFLKEGSVEDAKAGLLALSQKWEDIKRKASGEIDKTVVQ